MKKLRKASRKHELLEEEVGAALEAAQGAIDDVEALSEFVEDLEGRLEVKTKKLAEAQQHKHVLEEKVAELEQELERVRVSLQKHRQQKEEYLLKKMARSAPKRALRPYDQTTVPDDDVEEPSAGPGAGDTDEPETEEEELEEEVRRPAKKRAISRLTDDDSDSESDPSTGRRKQAAARKTFVSNLPKRTSKEEFKALRATTGRVPFSVGEKQALVRSYVTMGPQWAEIRRQGMFHPKRSSSDLKDLYRTLLKKYYGGDEKALKADKDAKMVIDA